MGRAEHGEKLTYSVIAEYLDITVNMARKHLSDRKIKINDIHSVLDFIVESRSSLPPSPPKSEKIEVVVEDEEIVEVEKEDDEDYGEYEPTVEVNGVLAPKSQVKKSYSGVK